MTAPTNEANSRTVCEFIRNISYEKLPEDVRAHARRCLLDTLGVAIAGTRLPLAEIVRNFVAGHIGAGSASSVPLFLDGRPVSVPGATMAAAAIIDSLDGHDGHVLCKGHMGVSVVPAALYFSQFTENEDWETLLTWVVIGYEIATRAGIALHATSTEFSSSGAWNALGVAAIGARALKLDDEKTRHALGTAEYYAPRSPLMRVVQYPSMLKDGSTFGGFSGATAAFLAADGFTGDPIELIDHYQSEAGDDLWTSLGSKWMILDQYFKPFPVCRWTQPALLAIQALQKANPGFNETDVERVEVRGFKEAISLMCRRPKGSDEAQYSLPFTVAAAIVHGKVGYDEVSEIGLTDERVLFHSEKMHLVEEPAFSAVFPGQRWSRVIITLKNGDILDSGDVTTIGDPQNPLSNDFIREKFLDNVIPVLGKTNSALLLDAITTNTASLRDVQLLLGTSPFLPD